MTTKALALTSGLILFALTGLCGSAGSAAETGTGFYKQPALFSTRPGETKSEQSIDRFGPVGMAIDLIQPAFTMRIKSIEEGSPAAATGKFGKGQIIESINGEALRDIDPRSSAAKMPVPTRTACAFGPSP